MTDDESYDVLVVGGGAAGLSGALLLARACRRVLVVDAGEPRNAPAGHVQGFLTRHGTPPGELLELGRAEVRGYGGEVRSGRVSEVTAVDGGFSVGLDDGTGSTARRLLVATGLVDQLPDVPGLRERWGRDVFHCPYCHGWEMRDRAIGVLGSGPLAVHGSLLIGQWTSDVTLFLHTGPPLTDEQREQLAARNVTVVEGEVAEIVTTDDQLTGVRMASGDLIPRQGVLVGPNVEPRAELLASLGLEPTDHPMGVGRYLAAVDPSGRTAVPGVWVAGNVTDVTGQVMGAAAAGTMAGGAINADLVADDVAAAVARAREVAA